MHLFENVNTYRFIQSINREHNMQRKREMHVNILRSDLNN